MYLLHCICGARVSLLYAAAAAAAGGDRRKSVRWRGEKGHTFPFFFLLLIVWSKRQRQRTGFCYTFSEEELIKSFRSESLASLSFSFVFIVGPGLKRECGSCIKSSSNGSSCSYSDNRLTERDNGPRQQEEEEEEEEYKKRHDNKPPLSIRYV